MTDPVVLVAKNGFEKMKFFGRRSVLTCFTNVANSENAFSCGFLRMERFNLARPVRQIWERGILTMWDPSDLAQTEDTLDALWEWVEFVGWSSWLPHEYSAGMDGVSSGRYHGCHMDALWEEFVGTSSWLPHGCSVGMDRVCGNVIMVATWMLCRNRWSLWERYQGCHMDALREWMEFVGTLSWLPHGVLCGNG